MAVRATVQKSHCLLHEMEELCSVSQKLIDVVLRGGSVEYGLFDVSRPQLI